VAAIGFLDFPVQEFFDPVSYHSLNTAHGRGNPVVARNGFMKIHRPALLSHFMSPARLTKIYMRKGPMTI
jgi:hypothetical protein